MTQFPSLYLMSSDFMSALEDLFPEASSVRNVTWMWVQLSIVKQRCGYLKQSLNWKLLFIHSFI